MGKTRVLCGNWGGETIRVVQGGGEKPVIGKDTPVQLQSISYKGLFYATYRGPAIDTKETAPGEASRGHYLTCIQATSCG